MARNFRERDEIVPGYLLLEYLGGGGFGEVWKASGPGDTRCAIKIVDIQGKQGRKEIQALELVKRINYTNLVPIFGFWVLDATRRVMDLQAVADAPPQSSHVRQTVLAAGAARNDLPHDLVIAMGLGEKSLFDRLKECLAESLPGVPVTELLSYLDDAARAIDYLNKPIHQTSSGIGPIYHCDIKPQNILIVGDAAQVCDYGLAKSDDDVRKTASATPAYGAPELFEGHVSRTTDQYSLAVTYFELRTGQLPFADESLMGILNAKRNGTLELSLLPPEEEVVIRRATAPVPDQRYANCRQLIAALQDAARNALGDAPGSGPRRLAGEAHERPTQPVTPAGSESIPLMAQTRLEVQTPLPQRVTPRGPATPLSETLNDVRSQELLQRLTPRTATVIDPGLSPVEPVAAVLSPGLASTASQPLSAAEPVAAPAPHAAPPWWRRPLPAASAAAAVFVLALAAALVVGDRWPNVPDDAPPGGTASAGTARPGGQTADNTPAVATAGTTETSGSPAGRAEVDPAAPLLGAEDDLLAARWAEARQRLAALDDLPPELHERRELLAILAVVNDPQVGDEQIDAALAAAGSALGRSDAPPGPLEVQVIEAVVALGMARGQYFQPVWQLLEKLPWSNQLPVQSQGRINSFLSTEIRRRIEQPDGADADRATLESLCQTALDRGSRDPLVSACLAEIRLENAGGAGAMPTLDARAASEIGKLLARDGHPAEAIADAWAAGYVSYVRALVEQAAPGALGNPQAARSDLVAAASAAHLHPAWLDSSRRARLIEAGLSASEEAATAGGANRGPAAPLERPFADSKSPDLAGQVADWLGAVRVLLADGSAADAASRERLETVSLLADYYRGGAEADEVARRAGAAALAERAQKLIDGGSGDLRVWLVAARAAAGSSDPAQRQRALERFAAIARRLEAEARQQPAAGHPHEESQDAASAATVEAALLRPAQPLIDEVAAAQAPPADAARAAAALLAYRGRLMALSSDAFSGELGGIEGVYRERLACFDRAVHLDGSQAAYYFGRGEAQARLLDQSLAGKPQERHAAYESVRADAEAGLKLQPASPRGHALRAYANLELARLDAQDFERSTALLEQVLGDYSQALATAAADGEPPPRPAEIANHRVGRANAAVELANKPAYWESNARRQQLIELLEGAIRDAQAAAEIESVEHPEYAWEAQGNAVEDLAWLARQNPGENYPRAIDLFTRAIDAKLAGAKVWLHRGRCRLKWAAHAEATLTAPLPTVIDDAMRDLAYAATLADDEALQQRAEIQHWIALALLIDPSFKRDAEKQKRADETQGEAVALLVEGGVPKFGDAVWQQYQWARVAAERFDWQAAAERAGKILEWVRLDPPLPFPISAQHQAEAALLAANALDHLKQYEPSLKICRENRPADLAACSAIHGPLLTQEAASLLEIPSFWEEENKAKVEQRQIEPLIERAIALTQSNDNPAHRARAPFIAVKVAEKYFKAKPNSRDCHRVREFARQAIAAIPGLEEQRTMRIYFGAFTIYALKYLGTDAPFADIKTKQQKLAFVDEGIRAVGELPLQPDSKNVLDTLNKQRASIEKLPDA